MRVRIRAWGRAAPSRKRRGAAREGQGLVFFLLMTPLFLSVMGLAIDGGMLFASRREAQNIADAAARAGAMEIDIERYRVTSGTGVELDPGAAGAEARSYLSLHGWTGSVTASTRSVTVTVGRDVPLGFLRIVGLESVSVSATASAAPYYGISEGRP